MIDKFIGSLPAEISKELIGDFLEKTSCRVVKKGEVITSSSESDRFVFYLLEGSCLRQIITSDGQLRTVMFHTESFLPMSGNFFIDDNDIPYQIVANEESTIIVLPVSFGLKWIEKDIAFAKYIFFNSIQYLSIMNQFQNHLLGMDTEDNLRWLYRDFGFLFKRFRSKDIANFMGITPIWLSKLKRKLFY
ncbi:MAG: Crp/Fnr family transcriptional regulator [Candidatus Cryptobacteroides sp.]